MKKIPTFIFLLFTIQCAFCQDEDYVDDEDPYGLNEWTDYMWCYRAGVGGQGSLYGEAGISRLSYVFYNVGQFSKAQYLSMEWIPTILPDKPRNTYAFKMGYEINLLNFALGLEGKYTTDFQDDTWIMTPRVGFGMLGIFNLFYGYNIWLTTQPFTEIGHHQLSVVLNLNRYLIKGDRSQSPGLD